MRDASGALLRLVRVAAILMLGLLALDLGDAGCDPLVPARAGAITTVPADDADPCSEICVDDCFCCSSSVAAVRPAPLSDATPPEVVASPGGGPVSPGFSHPLDHVPLAIG